MAAFPASLTTTATTRGIGWRAVLEQQQQQLDQLNISPQICEQFWIQCLRGEWAEADQRGSPEAPALFQRYVKWMKPPGPGSSAVDLAAGNGIASCYLAALLKWQSITAIDPLYTDPARSLKTAMLSSVLTWQQKRIEEVEFKDADLFFASDAIHHCPPKKVSELLQNIRRHLKPKGRFIANLLVESPVQEKLQWYISQCGAWYIPQSEDPEQLVRTLLCDHDFRVLECTYHIQYGEVTFVAECLSATPSVNGYVESLGALCRDVAALWITEGADFFLRPAGSEK